MDDDDRLLAYMQGRLGPDDAAALEAELASNDALQAELAMMQAARDSLSEDTVSTQEEVMAGWNRLAASIDAEDQRAPANDNLPRTLMQAAAVAVVSILGWQFVAEPLLTPAAPDGFVVASASDLPHVLQVGFTANATMEEVAGLVRQAGGRVVDGPGATGLFVLQFDDDAARDAAQALFSQTPELVMLSAQP